MCGPEVLFCHTCSEYETNHKEYDMHLTEREYECIPEQFKYIYAQSYSDEITISCGS